MEPEPIYCKYSDQIVNPYCKYLKNHYKLYCYGKGGGFLRNVNNIQLAFNGYKNLSVEEARVLVVECAEELLKRFNADEKIRPYLSHYPFTEEGLSLILGFDQENGREVDSNFIALALACNKKIYYQTYNHETKQLEDLYEESYQTALEIVKKTKSVEELSAANQRELSQEKSSKIKDAYLRLKEKFTKTKK